MKYVFGPVPSRRLGISLGVDLVPFKTCTFNCIYCQLGRTTNQTLKRKEYIRTQAILSELRAWFIRENSRKFVLPNYITLSGSGEPTLNSKIGEIVSEIKKMTTIPVAVLTNGSLLYRREVRDSLKKVDLVLPSLDAVAPKTFQRINRPLKSLGIERIVRGLMDFRKEYGGKIWLEVMLVKGINDRREEIEKLKRAIAKIKPDRIQLNTVARPPCERFAKALSNKELERIENLLGPPAEIIVDLGRRTLLSGMEDLKGRIISLLKRRPATVQELIDGLGVPKEEVLKYLIPLEKEKRIKSLKFRGKKYYQAK